MSQHYFMIEREDKTLVVMYGWDKPMQSVYLTLGYLNSAKCDWVEPLLLDINIPFDRVANLQYVDEIITHIKGRLAYFNVAMPDAVHSAVVDDIGNNTVNEMSFHGATGERSTISESPFDSGIWK